MVGGLPGDPPYEPTGAGDGGQFRVAGGEAHSFRWIWSRWCMLGTEDEPSGPDAWAARSWRAGTRRAYAQKLASGEASLAGVLAGFLAARAEAGERQSTLRGDNAAVRAAEDLGWIGPTVQQLHKRIAQAASKVGLQPYLPPEGLCVLVERAENQPGALPMACVAVLSWVLWLRVGEVFGLRMGDVSVPLWLRFWNSKTGEEGWQSRPISPWADRYREALLRWAEAKGMRPDDHLFPGGSAWLEHRFLEVLGPTPWRHCRWHALRRGGSAACYARHPQMQFFLWWGRWRSVGTALRYATTFQDAAVVGPLRLPTEPRAGGATRVLTHLEVWAPNMFPAEAEPLPAAAFHPPAWPEDLLDPPPSCTQACGGGGGDFQGELEPPDPPR